MKCDRCDTSNRWQHHTYCSHLVNGNWYKKSTNKKVFSFKWSCSFPNSTQTGYVAIGMRASWRPSVERWTNQCIIDRKLLVTQSFPHGRALGRAQWLWTVNYILFLRFILMLTRAGISSVKARSLKIAYEISLPISDAKLSITIYLESRDRLWFFLAWSSSGVFTPAIVSSPGPQFHVDCIHLKDTAKKIGSQRRFSS